MTLFAIQRAGAPRRRPDLRVGFYTPGADFDDIYSAEAWLAERGFSLGAMQGSDPRGILFGDFTIAKWRNLSVSQRAALHGQMVGRRGQPVWITIKGSISDEIYRIAEGMDAAAATAGGGPT